MVVDFEMSYNLSYKNDPFTGRGTAGFAAPEQYKAGLRIDARTDIYGLGMTMHYLVTCDLPKIK